MIRVWDWGKEPKKLILVQVRSFQIVQLCPGNSRTTKGGFLPFSTLFLYFTYWISIYNLIEEGGKVGLHCFKWIKAESQWCLGFRLQMWKRSFSFWHVVWYRTEGLKVSNRSIGPKIHLGWLFPDYLLHAFINTSDKDWLLVEDLSFQNLSSIFLSLGDISLYLPHFFHSRRIQITH